MTEDHKKKISESNKGRKVSESTRKKIGLANRGEWVKYNCEYCNVEKEQKKSHYIKAKRHFCSISCHSNFRKEKLPFTEQPSYKGVRKEGESKQIYHKRYVKNNPDIISHLKARRYAKEKNSKGSHTLEDWNKLKDSYGNVCAFCKSDEKLTKDHIIPISKNGTDFIENIQPLCKSCNSKKHNKINYIHSNPELLNQ